MIEAAAPVRSGPVAVAVAPPGVEPLVRRHEMAHRIDETAGTLQTAEPLDLDWRVADDLQELLVRPDIGFERRDVQIADCDHWPAGVALGGEPCGQLIEELQFMG